MSHYILLLLSLSTISCPLLYFRFFPSCGFCLDPWYCAEQLPSFMWSTSVPRRSDPGPGLFFPQPPQFCLLRMILKLQLLSYLFRISNHTTPESYALYLSTHRLFRVLIHFLGFFLFFFFFFFLFFVIFVFLGGRRVPAFPLLVRQMKDAEGKKTASVFNSP